MFVCKLFFFLNLVIFAYCSENYPSIIIVGAGPAGIAAATRLLKNNFTNIRVLEAENRIGGRIHSVKIDETFVDLGAEWCHGEKDNIVYEMMEPYGILRHTTTSSTLLYSNGTRIDHEVLESLLEFAESIDASQTKPDIEESCKNFLSIGECFEKEFNSTFAEKYNRNLTRLKIALDSALWLKHYMIGYDSPKTLFDLSRKSDYKRCIGDNRMNWDGRGYKTIFDVMMQKFPNGSIPLPFDEKLLLNKEVIRITLNNTSTKKLIRCLDSTLYEADLIIFTPSLGVLKESHQTIFDPSLPEEKIHAIRSMGFGAVLKVVLHFPNAWWDVNEQLGFVWSAEDRNKILSEFPQGPIKNGRSWLTSVIKFIPAENNPKVLIGFFSGDMISELEKEPDRVILDGCMYLFKQFLGRNYTITEPDQIIRSYWFSNPHFRGTYSYDSARSYYSGSKFPEKLGKPVHEENGNLAILFAGEATHPFYFSTVHGAIESGYREADRIINFYRNKYNIIY